HRTIKRELADIGRESSRLISAGFEISDQNSVVGIGQTVDLGGYAHQFIDDHDPADDRHFGPAVGSEQLAKVLIIEHLHDFVGDRLANFRRYLAASARE